MPAFLSEEWLDLHRSLGAELPERPGATARVQFVVSGKGADDVAYVQVIEDGRIISAVLGRDADADITLTCPQADALAIARGELDINAAFMQGRVKAVGDMGALMAAMPVTQSEEYRSLIASVAAATER